MGELRGNDFLEHQKMQHEEYLSDKDYLRKFRMFFTGLIFAVLSFIGSNPVITTIKHVKIIEIVALIFLFISGCLLLGKLSGIRVKPYVYKDVSWKFKPLYLIFNLDAHYWTFFIFGMLLLLIGRSIALLSS